MRRKTVDDVATDSPICVSAGEGVGRDHKVSLRVVQSISQGRDSHSDVSCLVGEPAVPLDFCLERDVIFLLQSPIYRRCVKLSVVEEEILSTVIGCMRDLFRPCVKGA